MSGPRRKILLVDDDPVEAELTLLHFREVGFDHDFTLAHDGKDAIERLEKAARGNEPVPDLVVLDLNMPRMTGHDVLGWLKEHAELRAVPAVVLSNSGLPGDERKAKELGARGYFVKPSGTAEVEKIAAELAKILESARP